MLRPLLGPDGKPISSEGKDLVSRRHPEWIEHDLRWRWLLDSYEGGDRYRQAIYGTDTRGLPIRNLIRHKREYPDMRERSAQTAQYLGGNAIGLAGAIGLVGSWGEGIGVGTLGPGATPGAVGADPFSMATDDDYELRRARTPVPTFLADTVATHLGEIYAKEVDRIVPDGLKDLKGWMEDVDGQGTCLDSWIEETIGPLLLVLGCIDVAFDHPQRPEGEDVVSRADELRLDLDRCVASYILPENVVWWRKGSDNLYREVLIREYADPDLASPTDKIRVHYRYWNSEESRLYDKDGAITSKTPHRFGRVPIRRLFDRKKPRCRNVGKPRYEGIAERMREFYNRDSELILSDTTQAHPLLQGPEDYVQADGTIPIGPNWLIPKKKNGAGKDATYEGFDVVEFPKEGAESLRQNKADIRDEIDRDAGLTKPAGSAGTNGKTVAQSGFSKQLDQKDGHSKLTAISKTLGRAERQIIEMALVVLRDDPDAGELAGGVTIAYPTSFCLGSADDLADTWTKFQGLMEAAGVIPETEIVAFMEIVRKTLPGRDDAFYEEAEEEIRKAVEAAEERSQQSLEMRLADDGTDDDDSTPNPLGGGDAGGESDPPAMPPAAIMP